MNQFLNRSPKSGKATFVIGSLISQRGLYHAPGTRSDGAVFHKLPGPQQDAINKTVRVPPRPPFPFTQPVGITLVFFLTISDNNVKANHFIPLQLRNYTVFRIRIQKVKGSYEKLDIPDHGVFPVSTVSSEAVRKLPPPRQIRRVLQKSYSSTQGKIPVRKKTAQCNSGHGQNYPGNGRLQGESTAHRCGHHLRRNT